MWKFLSNISKFKKPGSATILMLFILSGMLIIVMSGVYVLLLGIVSSRIQANSNKAYFAAEAGVEKLLWGVRKKDLYISKSEINEPILEGSLPNSEATYTIRYQPQGADKFFISEGQFLNTKRSVEVRF